MIHKPKWSTPVDALGMGSVFEQAVTSRLFEQPTSCRLDVQAPTADQLHSRG